MKSKPVKLSEESMDKAMRWIVGEDTGISSKTIWAMMMVGEPPSIDHPPSDTSDFGRCHRLLKLIPEFEQSLERMRGIKRKSIVNGGPREGGWIEEDTWAVLVDNYRKLCDLYEIGVKNNDGRSFYNFWKEIIKTEK